MSTTTTRPRVSVVVPGKDVESYVADALTSLTRQMEDPRQLEVVVVDDGSRDNTGEVAESFRSRLPNLTILRNESPGGVASARNKGLAATTGRYVAYLDSDDWLAPRRLSVLADAIEHLRVAFLFTDHTTVAGRKRNLVRAPQARRGVVLDPRDSILPENHSTMVDYPYSWAVLFDRELLHDGFMTFPDGLHSAEDRPWIWNLFLNGPPYAVVDAPTLCYRRDVETSLTATYDRRQLDIFPALERVLDLVRADRESEKYAPKIARTVMALMSHHMRRSNRMTREVRAELRSRASHLISQLPHDLLVREIREMSRERARSLHGLLPAGVSDRRRAAADGGDR
ncbi:glycosyltransferase [Georgenia alba]|uniref:Glycosyltransferase n=1 Tax=Georgenia alba TaxID=2233858 RepID=A0ABW2Q6A4_9MICO